jgi:pantetheine-phosphate adenylyltransferase
MKKAIYPGSFDPLTFGHLDIIERSVRLFDRVVVAIITNPAKQSLFSIEERKEMLETNAVTRFANVEVDVFHGLLVDFAKSKEANAIVRGIRAVTDYEYELQMALMNRRLAPGIETVFLMASEQYSYVSSRLVKEVAGFGGSVKDLIPADVERRLRKKLRKP